MVEKREAFDCLGRPLEVGKFVAFHRCSAGQLLIGKIIDITPAKVKVARMNSKYYYYPNDRQTILINDDQAVSWWILSNKR